MKILYITYDPETSKYCGIYRASIEYINSIKLVYKNIDSIGLNKFLEGTLNLNYYDIVIIHTSLSDRVQKAIRMIKRYYHIKLGLLVIYETENLPRIWRSYSYGTNFFIVPTYLMKNILINNGYKEDIYVIQHNIQDEILNSNIPKIKNNYYIFYTICKIDDPRKNIKNLIQTYLNTFTKDDKVFLYIKGYKNNKIPQFQLKSNSPLFKIDTRNISNEEIIEIHKNSDCYISIAHSEGVGLGMLEASTIGNPVITNKYGGQMEYIKYGYFIDYNLKEIDLDYGYFNKNQYWSYPNYKHATNILKEVYYHQNEAKKIGLKNKLYVIENFNSLKIGNKFVSTLKSII